MCSLCRLPVAENHIFGKFLTFGGSCIGPILPMRVKFGVLKQTEHLHLQAKFHLNVFIVSASGGQTPQFWANCDFCGLLYRPPFTDDGQIWCAIADSQCTFLCQNSRSVYSIALWRRKPSIFAVLGTNFLMMSTVGGNLRKLNTGAQLQTFPYPTASKSFLYSNAFMPKSGEQTLTFKSVTDRQSVTDKQKNQRFSPPRRRVKSEPHQTWHGDRGPRARSCTSKMFWGSDA